MCSSVKESMKQESGVDKRLRIKIELVKLVYRRMKMRIVSRWLKSLPSGMMRKKPRRAKSYSTLIGLFHFIVSRSVLSEYRTRWRAQRKAFRQREINEDKKDAELETQQLEKLQKQSESFLNQQADAFAKMTAGTAANTKRTGTPAEEAGGPIKLSLAERAKKEQEVKPVEVAPRSRPAAFGAADDQEETGKKKRELVRLTYSDDEGEVEDENERGLTQEEKVERRKRKIKELVDTIPTSKEGLWAYEIRWERMTEVRVLSIADIEADLAPDRRKWSMTRFSHSRSRKS